MTSIYLKVTGQLEEINKLSDNEIVLLLQDGNMRYFSVFADRHEKAIIRKCKTFVRDDDTAEDLTQEILIKIFLKINDFHNQAKFSTWLYAIIHNTCIDFLRKNKRNVREILTEKMIDEISDMIDEVDEISDDLSELILDQLLDSISPEEKLVLVLKYKEKHSIKDIQIALNLSESAVKMRLKRAKDKVNALYKMNKNIY